MSDILCLIPARSGSKGLKNKNIKLFNGIPLILYPYNIAKQSRFITDIAITSDSKKYLNFFKKKNIFKILRPKKISQSKSKIYDVIIHALTKLKKHYEYIVLLEPTSPLTSVKEIDKAIQILTSKKNNINSVVSVVFNHKFLSVFKIDLNKDLRIKNNFKIKDLNRQNFKKKEYYFSGNFYAAKIEYLKKVKSFIDKGTYCFPIKDSIHTDIDDIKDFISAECILKKKLYRFKKN
jgi:CMP-N,N'-diacetyllegionaminic acid synthase